MLIEAAAIDGSAYRECLWPDCAERFDVVAVMCGTATAPGWLLIRSIGAVYLCPTHATSGHIPALRHNDGESTLSCECPWLVTAQPADTLGSLIGMWRSHARGEA